MTSSLLAQKIALLLTSILFLCTAIALTQKKKSPQSVLNESVSGSGIVVILICWAMVPVFFAFKSQIEAYPTVVIIWNLTLWIGLIIAICMALMKLFNFDSDFKKVRASKSYAWRTLLLSFSFVIAMGFLLMDEESRFMRQIVGDKSINEEKIELPVDIFTGIYESNHFHYSVIGSGSLWEKWKDVNQDIRFADFGLSNNDDTYYVVIPFYLENGMPNQEVLVNASAPMINLPAHKPWQGVYERHSQDGFEGYVFDFNHQIDQQSFQYKMKVLSNSQYAYVMAAWSKHQNENRREALLNNIHNRTSIRFDPRTSSGPVLDQLDKGIQKRHGKLYENIGHEYLKVGDYEKSLKFLEQSADYQPMDAAVLGSIVYAYLNQSRYSEAQNYLEQYLERYPEGTFLYDMLKEIRIEDLDEVEQDQVPDEVLGELVKAFGELPSFEFSEVDFSNLEKDFDRNYQSRKQTKKRADKADKKRKAGKRRQRSLSSFNPITSKDETQTLEALGAENLNLEHAVYFQKGHPFRRTERRDLEITNRDGALKYQYMYIPFSDQEQISVNFVQVRSRKGDVRFAADPGDQHILEGEEEFSGQNVLNIALPDLNVGDVIESSFNWVTFDDLDEIDYYEYSFATKFLTHKHSFKFVGDPDAVTLKSSPSLEESRAGSEIIWILNHQKSQSVSSQANEKVWIGDRNKNWEAEAAKVIEGINEFLQYHEDLSSIARRLTAHIPEVKDKVFVLAKFVQETLIYNDDLLDPEMLVSPLDFIDFKDTGNANSYFYTLYFKKMLLGIGVQSQVVLTRNKGIFEREIPSLSQFDYSILVTTIKEESLHFDIANEGIELGEIPSGRRGQEALQLGSESSKFVKLGSY